MSQDFSFREQAFLLVEDSVQQIVRIDNPFHQDIGSPFADDTHRFTRRFVGVLYMKGFHIFGILLECGIFLQNG